MTDKVDILLATYQGASYIKAQIQSILNQTYPYIHLWIRDDGSSDITPNLIEQIASFYPDRISIIPSHKNLGIRGNFSELMAYSKAKYIMFSDQDDIWLPEKIELSLNAMKKMEKDHGDQTPLLVHTDLKIVRNDLSLISNSFWEYARLNPNATSLNRLLTQNVLTGCTMLLNRPLVNLSLPIPKGSIMHDWWIALVAAAFGQITHVQTPTMLYRQHNSNDIGAKQYGILSYFQQTRNKKRQCVKSYWTKQTYEQAELFFERYSPLLNSTNVDIVKAYADLGRLSYLRQKQQILKYQFYKSGFLRNLKHLIT